MIRRQDGPTIEDAARIAYETLRAHEKACGRSLPTWAKADQDNHVAAARALVDSHPRPPGNDIFTFVVQATLGLTVCVPDEGDVNDFDEDEPCASLTLRNGMHRDGVVVVAPENTSLQRMTRVGQRFRDTARTLNLRGRWTVEVQGKAQRGRAG